ncbi:MAG: GNAT family N-acetyltransferase [Caldiserica bacterium]|jgi:GNAT superfamily N-acetyltransferase|nr:GNAT family N-acetyltransferase [Caldisericota bacterium]MDH7562565.1 GNAT family N-acetyltransferase [Caldisericota bacterium]
MELNEIEFGLYREGEEIQILDLFHRVFPKIPRTLEEWEWEYRESPFSPPIIAIARAGGKVIGQEALFFVPMKFKGNCFQGAQSVDTMTDPNFRGKGVFGRLARLTLEEGKKRNTPLFYGFPNRNSYSAYVNKLNWIDVARVQRFIKVLDLTSALKARINNPSLRMVLGFLGKPFLKAYFWGKGKRDPRFSLHQVDRFGESYDRLWGELRGRFPLMVDRTSAYMNWRYLDHPSGVYRAFFLRKAGNDEIFGVAVLHIVDLEYRLGSIGEFLVKDWDPEIARIFLTLLLDYFKLQGTAIVATWTLPHSPFVPVFKSLGFRLRSQHQPLIAISPDGSLEKEEIRNPENWFISSGDYDMF